MPHISKRKIPKEHLKHLQNELVRSFERSFKDLHTRAVFGEFFTYTEKIMFAKRLAVIAMLSKGISSFMISEVLAMSPATTARMSAKFEMGKYDSIIKKALGKKDIWDIIELMLSAGGIMPPIVGGKRWRSWDKAIYKENLKRS